MISLQNKVAVLTHSNECCYDRYNKLCNELNVGEYHSNLRDGGPYQTVIHDTHRSLANLEKHGRLFNPTELTDMMQTPRHCLGTVLSLVDNPRNLSYPPTMLETIDCTQRVEQTVAYVQYEDKMDRLMSHLLTGNALHEGLPSQVIISVTRSSTGRYVEDVLRKRGFPVCSVHELQRFTQGLCPTLVIPERSSYVAAGLRMTAPVVHVINYDAPVSLQDYSQYLAHIYRRARCMPPRSIDVEHYMQLFQTSLTSLKRQLDRIVKTAESIKPCAAHSIARWWRRRQLEMHRARIHRSAFVLQQWIRSTLHRVRVQSEQIQRDAAVRLQQTTHAATSIQVWRRYIVNRRKKAKLAAAALSCAFRERGQPLPPRSRRTRYRQKQRAEGKRRSKRYRPSRKRGQQRGRPPDSVQQQTSPSSVERSENVLGKAHHIQRDLSSRGKSIGKALHLNNSVSSCRGNDIGKALTDSIVSSSRGELDKPSTRRHLDPTSSDENKPRRRHRRRKTRNPSGFGKRGGVSASKCHTQGATYSPPASQLPRKSELRDMFRSQFQQAAPEDRSLLINLMFEVLKEAVESMHHPRPSPPVPEELIEEPSSMYSSTSVNGDPPVPFSSSSLVEPSSLTFCSSPSSESDASSSTSVVDIQTSSTSVGHLSVANKAGSSPPFLLEVLRTPSSHKSVDSPPPSSTTLLVESIPSSSAITEEITDRRQQLNYLQALLGKAPNIG